MPLERQVGYSGRKSRERATPKCQAILQPLQIFLQPNMKVRGLLNLRSIHSGSSCIINYLAACRTNLCVHAFQSVVGDRRPVGVYCVSIVYRRCNRHMGKKGKGKAGRNSNIVKNRVFCVRAGYSCGCIWVTVRADNEAIVLAWLQARSWCGLPALCALICIKPFNWDHIFYMGVLYYLIGESVPQKTLLV